MSCCPVAHSKSKADFIIEKARNFRDYISTLGPHESIKEVLGGFDENVVIPTIATVVVPLVIAGKVEECVDDIMKKLTVEEKNQPEVKNKLIRYITMFGTVLAAK